MDHFNSSEADTCNPHSRRRWRLAVVAIGVTAGALALATSAASASDQSPGGDVYHSFGVRW